MVHDTVQSLLIHSDNIFICISDEIELRLFFRDNFSYKTEEKMLQGKGIVIMTSMSTGTAKDMKDLIEKKGGRYLEALIQWSSVDNGRFILLAAGDEMLFRSIQPCTKAFSISIEFLGDAGSACCVYLILQLIKGVCLAGLSEGMQLAERFGLNSSFLQTVFESSQLSSNYLKDKMAKIIDEQVDSSDQRLEDLETGLKLVLDLSNELDETDQVRDSLETCAISHQLLKHFCKLDYGSFEPAAIHLRNKD
nr:unnamed protein product [Callosobruchus chinensis]